MGPENIFAVAVQIIVVLVATVLAVGVIAFALVVISSFCIGAWRAIRAALSKGKTP